MKDINTLRKEYGDGEVDHAINILNSMLKSILSMCEVSARAWEARGDEHAAMVLRTFKDSLASAWTKTTGESRTVQ